MHRIFRRTATVFAVLLIPAIATTCKDSSGPAEDRVTHINASSGDLQGGIVAQPLTQPVVALALDAEDRPVRGALAMWAVTTGGGTITAVEDNSDSNGLARAQWVLGPVAGEQTATVTIGTATYTFRATALAGPATAVSVSPADLVIDALNANAGLTASARDQYDNPVTGRPFTWTSQNTNVATVNSSGVVTSRSVGATRVDATLDGVTGSSNVTVAPVPASITLNPPGASFTAVGQNTQFVATARDRNGNLIALQPTGFLWSSTDPNVVTVSTTGLAMAVGSGFAQIVAAVGAVNGVAQVTVAQTPVSLTIAPQVDTLTTVKPATLLTVTGRDSNNGVINNPAVTWSTDDATIATMAQNGQVTAVKNGTVKVRATSTANTMVVDSATIVVRLNAPPKTVADVYGAITNTSIVIAAPGVLANDTLGIPAGMVTSFGGGSLGGTVTLAVAGAVLSFGTGGSLQLSPNGALVFTPSTGFNGAFTFMYRVQTVAGTSDAMVTIHVGDPPMAVDDAYMTAMNVPLTITPPGVLMNDDLGFPVSAVASFGGGTLGGAVTTFPAGQLVHFASGGFAGGQFRLQADGALTFTPPTGYTGVVTVMYRLSNGVVSTDATITITVAPMPDS